MTGRMTVAVDFPAHIAETFLGAAAAAGRINRDGSVCCDHLILVHPRMLEGGSPDAPGAAAHRPRPEARL